MEDICDRNWDFLVPWCHQVFYRLRYSKGALGDAPGQGFRGIQVELPSFEPWSDEEEVNDGKPPCQDLREALGLLATVAHVDNAAWKKMLVENAKLEINNQEEIFEGEFLPRFQLSLIDYGLDNNGELLKGITEFCGTEQYTSQSAAYKATLTKIAAMNNGKSCTRSTEIEIPVSIQLGPWLTQSSEDMLEYLRNTQKTIHAIRMQWQQYFDRERTPLSAVFVLESIMADLQDVHITAELAEVIENFAHDGIRMSGLAMRHELDHRLMSNGSFQEARKTVGKLMFGLFGGTKKVGEQEWNYGTMSITGPLTDEFGHGSQLALDFVHFDCEAMQNWVFERICSAVAVNQTTRHLSLGLELNDASDDDDDGDWELCRWRWQWIMLACFSERARLHSRLENLTLCDAVITTDAVEAMAAVLASNGPEEGLLGYPCLSSDASIDICIKAGSPIKLSSMTVDETLSNSNSFTLGRDIAGVRRISEDHQNDWVDVLVPGFGICQVQRTSLIYKELALPSNGLAGVTSLTVKFCEDPDPEVLQGLLLLVGASLTHLTLEFEDFNSSELEGIVASCPKLVELAVCTHAIEIRFCLRDSNYRDLALHSTSHFSFFTDIKQIVEALCDSENPFTKCAWRMRVRMDQRAVYLHYEDCYVALLKLLEMNRTLEYLDVVARRIHIAYFNDFKAHHLKPLPVAHAALSMECKTAFLSVMGTRRSERRDAKRRRQLPLPMLDQYVLVCVFEYAAPHVIRRVYFREYDFFETGRNSTPI